MDSNLDYSNLTPEEFKKVLEQRQFKIVEELEKKALACVEVLGSTLSFYANNDLEIDNQKLRIQAAESILDRAGFSPKKHFQLTGKDGGAIKFEPLIISRGDLD